MPKPKLIPVLEKDTIQKLIVETAKKISRDYKDKDLVFIGVLKGSFIFLADLVRCITIPVKIDFISASSYGSECVSSGNVNISGKPGIDLSGKDVLIIEDIVDSGLTLDKLVSHIKSLGPKSVKICAFIDKRENRKTDVSIEYACHIVNDGFLIGYGLDHAEDFRQLPDIYKLEF